MRANCPGGQCPPASTMWDATTLTWGRDAEQPAQLGASRQGFRAPGFSSWHCPDWLGGTGQAIPLSLLRLGPGSWTLLLPLGTLLPTYPPLGTGLWGCRRNPDSLSINVAAWAGHLRAAGSAGSPLPLTPEPPRYSRLSGAARGPGSHSPLWAGGGGAGGRLGRRRPPRAPLLLLRVPEPWAGSVRTRSTKTTWQTRGAMGKTNPAPLPGQGGRDRAILIQIGAGAVKGTNGLQATGMSQPILSARQCTQASRGSPGPLGLSRPGPGSRLTRG